MGPILATRIWDNLYGTHAEPGCSPYMGPIWVAHIGPTYACLFGRCMFTLNVQRLFLAVPLVVMQCVIVVCPNQFHLLFA